MKNVIYLHETFLKGNSPKTRVIFVEQKYFESADRKVLNLLQHINCEKNFI